MKKRIRRKKRVGDFQEFGFDVDATLRANMDREALYAFCDRFIAHIEANSIPRRNITIDVDALHLM